MARLHRATRLRRAVRPVRLALQVLSGVRETARLLSVLTIKSFGRTGSLAAAAAAGFIPRASPLHLPLILFFEPFSNQINNDLIVKRINKITANISTGLQKKAGKSLQMTLAGLRVVKVEFLNFV